MTKAAAARNETGAPADTEAFFEAPLSQAVVHSSFRRKSHSLDRF